MDELSLTLEGYSAVSIIGLCKNAGKTTAFNKIITELGKKNVPLGLTSIGRDGESTDLVTGTQKPAIYVRAGTLIATAQGLLRYCDITREIIDNTSISTPLGDVIIVRALSDGHVQLAGPSIVAQLAEIKRRFFALGAQKVLIDGAISRKTLCTRELADAAVLCAGASCGSDMACVVAEAAHYCRVLSLPEVSSAALDAAVRQNPDARAILLGEGDFVPPEGMGLESALRKRADTDTVFISGAVSDALMRPVAVSGVNLKDVTFVARDASKIMLSPDTLEKLEIRGARLAVLDSVKLAAVTVNPFSAYGLHFDRRAFLRAMTKALPVPVFDVLGGEN